MNEMQNEHRAAVSEPHADEATLAAVAVEASAAAGNGASVVFLERHPFGPMSQVEKYRLSNGLGVLLSVDRSAPVLAYQVWFRVGSRHERVGRTGMAHLFEHLMFKATRNLPEGEFDRLLEEAGVSTNAATWLDWTFYRDSLPTEALPLVLRLEADRMRNLLLTSEQLEAERSVVMNERALRVDNDPDGKMYEELYHLAFPSHPYGWPTIGWMPDIAAITLEDCLEFYRLYYAPTNAVLVIVGDQDRRATLDLVLAHYGSIPAQDAPVEAIPPEPDQDGERRAELRLPLSSPKLVHGYRSPSMSHPDLPALEVTNEVLFNSDSARLYKLLVTDRELASSAMGSVSSFALPGLYEIAVTVKDGVDPAEVERVIDEELRTLATTGPTERELTKARNKLEADFIRGTLSVGSRARVLGTYEATAGDYRLFFRVVDAYRAVTAEDVMRVTGQYLNAAQRTVILALPALAKGAGGAAVATEEDDELVDDDEEEGQDA